MLLSGKVLLNGKIWQQGDSWQVCDGDIVEIEGKVVSPKEDVKLWAYHKPVGLVVSHKDEKGRASVFDEIDIDERVISIGRLDINTEGLLLLTNSGELAREYEMGDFQRVYEVKVLGDIVTSEQIENLKNGIEIDGIRYGSIKLEIMNVKEKSGHYWLRFIITEGKNREIRNICKYLGLRISRLKRVQYGKFTLGSLKKGKVKLLS